MSSLQFTPVRGKPGIWLAPSRDVLDIALAGGAIDSRLYWEIVEVNQPLFKNGPPTPIIIKTGRKEFVPKVEGGLKLVEKVERSLEVVRAPYKAPEYSSPFHPHDPRLNPSYKYLYAH